MSTAVQLRTIHLHGFLGEEFGKEVTLAGNNWFQLLSGLKHRFGQKFAEVMKEHNWHLLDGEVKAGNDLFEENLNRDLANKEFHILPAIEGASSGLRIIVGIIVVLVGTFVPGMQWITPAGYSLIIGGVAEMLMKPKGLDKNKQADEGQSSLFNSALMVTTQGGPVPVVYGRVRRASSVVISTDFSSEREFVYQNHDFYWRSGPGGIFKWVIDQQENYNET